jgi:hypothetical protein
VVVADPSTPSHRYDERQLAAARIASKKAVAFKGFGVFHLINGEVQPVFGYEGWCSRPESHEETKKLLQSFKRKGVLWMNFPVPLIASRDEIDFSSLTCDLSKAPSHMIKWLAKALLQGRIDAAGGQHRRNALQLLHEQLWDPAIQKAQSKASNARKHNPPNVAEAAAFDKDAESLLREKQDDTVWVGAVYERGRERCHQILNMTFIDGICRKCR